MQNLPRFGHDFFSIYSSAFGFGENDFREEFWQPDKEIVFKRAIWSLHIDDSPWLVEVLFVKSH